MLTERDAYKVFVRWVLRPALPHRRAALREKFYSVWYAATPLWNFCYWSRRPVEYFRLRRRVRILVDGGAYVDA